MKYLVGFLVAVVIVLIFVASYFYLKSNHSSIAPTPIPSPQSSSETSPSPTPKASYCDISQLSANLSLSPGAGNVYGTFTITNNSSGSCKIQGGNLIEASYDKSAVKNLSVSYLGNTQSSNFVLGPNKSIYSQVHYPNGPQCSSATKNTSVIFTYQINPAQKITFKSGNNTSQNVPTCQSDSEDTEINLWNMASSPLTPQ